jgi:hypothetical protein
MAITVELIVAFLILIPFIIINLLISFGLFLHRRIATFLLKKFGEKDYFKRSHYKKFSILHAFIWITIGLLNVLLLDEKISLSSIIVFLSFGSGAKISKRFIFGIHDIRIIKRQFTNNKIESKLTFLVRLGIIIELSFLVIWALLYQYLNISVKSLLGIDVNILVIMLWIIGFIYGILSSLILSKISNQILLHNEFGIAMLLSGQLLRDKVENKIKRIRGLFKI